MVRIRHRSLPVLWTHSLRIKLRSDFSRRRFWIATHPRKIASAAAVGEMTWKTAYVFAETESGKVINETKNDTAVDAQKEAAENQMVDSVFASERAPSSLSDRG